MIDMSKLNPAQAGIVAAIERSLFDAPALIMRQYDLDHPAHYNPMTQKAIITEDN